MGEYQSTQLDGVFNALCDPTRRAILARLTDTDARVTDIAAEFPISLNSISKHIRMLERAGLVRRSMRGATTCCRSNAAPLAEAAEWIEHYRRFWEGRLAALEKFVTQRKEETQMNAATRHPPPRSSSAAPSPPPPKICSMPGSTPKRWPLDAARHHPAARWRASNRASAAATKSPCRRVGPDPAQAACTASSIGRAAWCSPGIHRMHAKTETLVTVDFVPRGRAHRSRRHPRAAARERQAVASQRGWTSGLEQLDEACQQGSVSSDQEKSSMSNIRITAFKWVPPLRPRPGARPARALGARRSRPALRRKAARPGRTELARASRRAALRPGAGVRRGRTHAVRIRRHRHAHRREVARRCCPPIRRSARAPAPGCSPR